MERWRGGVVSLVNCGSVFLYGVVGSEMGGGEKGEVVTRKKKAFTVS